MNPTEPTQGDQLRSIKLADMPPIFHKLDGYACSFDYLSPVHKMIRDAQNVIAIQFTNLMHDKQTMFEQECTIEELEKSINERRVASGRPTAKPAEPETTSDTSSSTSKPPLTLEDTYQGLLVCGFRGPSWSQDAEIVVKLLMTNTHAKYIALSHFGIRHISQVLARELPRICVHRRLSGNFVVNPFFDFSHGDRVNELGAEPQSDPGDEQPEEAFTMTRNVEDHVKYLCDLAGVSYDMGTWKDWLQEVGRKFPIHLNSSDGGAKDGQDETV